VVESDSRVRLLVWLVITSRLVDRDDYRAAAERTLLAAGEVLVKQSAACGALVSALDRYWHDKEQIVLAVKDVETMNAFRPRFLKPLRPHATLSWVVGEPAEADATVALNEHREAIDGEPTLYHCRDFTCQRPIVGADVERWLS